MEMVSTESAAFDPLSTNDIDRLGPGGRAGGSSMVENFTVL